MVDDAFKLSLDFLKDGIPEIFSMMQRSRYALTIGSGFRISFRKWGTLLVCFDFFDSPALQF
jgi:hypothetical protein